MNSNHELIINGPIMRQQTSAKQIIGLLDSKVPDDANLDVYLNSRGGDVDEGKAIYSRLLTRSGETNVIVTSIAGSTAMWIALAGTKTTMFEHSQMKTHRSMKYIPPNLVNIAGVETLEHDLAKVKPELNQQDGIIANIIAKRSGQMLETVEKWMVDERSFTAEEAVSFNLAQEIIKHEPRVMNMIHKQKISNDSEMNWTEETFNVTHIPPNGEVNETDVNETPPVVIPRSQVQPAPITQDVVEKMQREIKLLGDRVDVLNAKTS